jgi:tRNA(fMet)-specific endonuclease VapC
VGVILDTSVLVAAERGEFDFERFVAGERIDDARIAAVTASELLQGVERGRPGAARQKREDFVESVLERIPVEPFTLDTARIHARLWAAASSRGVGAHDLIIAATASERGFSVATLNERDFRRIEGVTLAPTRPYR